MQYMASRCLVRVKEVRDDGSVVELVIWELDDFQHDVENWESEA